jgi:hypothetical protein
VNGWGAALDCYEAALDAHEARLGAGEDPHPVAWPPRWPLPSGGVPPEHQDRAYRLLARTRDLIERATRARDDLPAPQAARRPAASRHPVTASRVDRAL